MAGEAQRLHRGGAGLALSVLLAVGCVWACARRDPPATPEPAAAASAVEVPLRPIVSASDFDARRVTVTVRWGHPSRRLAPRTGPTMQWDGYLSLDCGDIERVEPLSLESGEDGDRIGPVVRGEQGDQRIYWRSRTLDDDDGVKVQLTACRAPAPEAADALRRTSSLRVVTPQRTYVARLDWSVDDFVSLKVGDDGATLDVHISAQRDARTVRGARVTRAQGPLKPEAPVSAGPAVDAADTPKPL